MRYVALLIIVFHYSDLASQEIAFTIPERDLIPEGITYDPVTGDFYISSIFKNKIVKVSKGKATDFIKSDHDGFMGGVGLHVDSARRILWACSGNIMGNKFRRGVHAFDLNTGKLLKKVTYPTDTVKNFFNDLVIANSGAVYITDTFDHSIWEWSLSMESPVQSELNPIKLNLDGPVEYPNGITISQDNRFLFVATAKGLKRINLNNHTVTPLQMPAGTVTSAGLDGIAFYKNSIFGVQNGHDKNSDMKIIRYVLSDDFEKIDTVEVLDTGNKHFAVPTTLTVVNGELFVLANSQLDNLDQENLKIKQPEKLTQTVILKYKLP